MTKILFLMKFLKGGGAEKVLLTILENIDYTKYQVSLGLIFNEGIYIPQIPKNVKLFYIFEKETIENHQWAYENAAELYRTYITEKYDIEIAFLEGLCTKIISKSPQLSKKIAWVHIDLYECHYTKYAYLSDIEEELAYQQFHEIIFVSQTVQKQFYKLFPNLSEKGKIIYNPLDVKSVAKMSNEFSIYFPKTTFLSIGRLTDQKGFDRLILATKDLIERGFDFKVIILGEGPKEHDLKQQINKLNLEHYIELLGFKENPYPYLLAADAFISSSRSEGLALVLCEAMILKKYIIATKCAGVAEALLDGAYGHIVENSQNGIYYGMYRYLTEKQQYNIDDFALEHFLIDYAMSKIYELF